MAKINGTELFYIDVGPRLAPTIVFIHGFPLDHTMWQAQLDYFSKKYRCVAPDLRGFSKSALYGNDFTIDLLADDVNALMEFLGIERGTICGFSMGGYVAFALWRKYSHRFNKLILVDTKATRDSPETLSNRYNLIEQVSKNGVQAVIAMQLDKLIHPRSQKTPLSAKIRKMMRATPAGNIIHAIRAIILRADAISSLATINVPTCIIVGENDQLTPPSEAETIRDRIPNAQMHIIKNSGHMSPMESPHEANDIIAKFLNA